MRRELQSISCCLLQAEAGDSGFRPSCEDGCNRWIDSISALLKGELQQAMVHLLAYPPTGGDLTSDVADFYWLLCLISALMRDQQKQLLCIKKLGLVVGWHDWRVLQATSQLKRQQGRRPSEFLDFDRSNLNGNLCPHLEFERIYSLLELQNLDEAAERLAKIEYFDSCDSIILQSKLMFRKQNAEAAEELLLANINRCIPRLDYCEWLVEVLFELERGDLCLPVLNTILKVHPQASFSLLERYAQAKLLQRQPAQALRVKLLERLPKFSGSVVASPTVLSPAYDFLGRADWFDYLHPLVRSLPDVYGALYSNVLMHSSSHALDVFPSLASDLVDFLSQKIRSFIPPFLFRGSSQLVQTRAMNKFRIGWICGDIGNHPVCRFLYSWLVAVPEGSLQHQHVVVTTQSFDDGYRDLIANIPDVQFSDLSSHRTLVDQVKAIRDLNLDLVVDLNGWTGKNIATAFIARLALVQVNYLGFHASTGIPEMDCWLVDEHLLPQSSQLQEWHTESLVRLPRPFLAWQPPAALPEGRVEVTSFAHSSESPIRFGCFNHSRKISMQCLKSWAELMRQVPHAQLVLKAFAADDTGTAELLTRRLRRAGLDLERVVFLPYSATPEDHLKQYEQMDVALDSFPNTGCTTTCEALWMGVPVITLEGRHYVTRMAAAVLAGAELHEWITSSVEQYLERAVQQAEPKRLAWLRQNRNSWRDQVQQSLLGDATNLMQSLESTFGELIESAIESHVA